MQIRKNDESWTRKRKRQGLEGRRRREEFKMDMIRLENREEVIG